MLNPLQKVSALKPNDNLLCALVQVVCHSGFIEIIILDWHWPTLLQGNIWFPIREYGNNLNMFFINVEAKAIKRTKYVYLNEIMTRDK